MKQCKINNNLWVFETVPYAISEDTDVDKIYIPEDSYNGYVELNPNLNLTKYNYGVIRVTEPEYYEAVHNYSLDYFTIEALEDGIIKLYISNQTIDKFKSLSVSKNGSHYWRTFYNPGDMKKGLYWDINVKRGDKVRLKGEATIIRYYFLGGCKHKVYGNIMSLLYNDEFIGKTLINGTNNAAFAYMFEDDKDLISAKHLILPPTTTKQCYTHMFGYCEELIEAPIIQAQRLEDYACGNMFEGCTKLKEVTCLATELYDDDVYWYMLYETAANGTFYKNQSSTINWKRGEDRIPSTWTIADYTEE